jgi:hypothetical protein
MYNSFTPVDLTSHFERLFGSDGPDPDMFADENGTLDENCYGHALVFAVAYVDKLDLGEAEWFLRRSISDYLAFVYFAELSKEKTLEAPYSGRITKAVYWAAVSVTLALLFHYVRNLREVALAPFDA